MSQFENPHITNVDQPAIETSLLGKHFDVDGNPVFARPLNADDYWILKAVFPEWTTLETSDLLNDFGFDALLFCIWLGVRRDTLKMRSKASVDRMIQPFEYMSWNEVLSHIVKVPFVSSENSTWGSTKPEDTLTKLKNMETGNVV